MVTVRACQKADTPALHAIFYTTIRTINRKDYTQAQVKAWAPDNYDPALWAQRIEKINPFVACEGNEIVGYADVQQDGYIDHFFCHHEHQGKGVGTALMGAIETRRRALGLKRLYAHVSITARPFFEHFGFSVVKQQQVDIRGEVLTNFVMEKVFPD